jgi:hypothetical protein
VVVGVVESGDDDAAARVDDPGVGRGERAYLSGGTEGDDAIAANGEGFGPGLGGIGGKDLGIDDDDGGRRGGARGKKEQSKCTTEHG